MLKSGGMSQRLRGREGTVVRTILHVDMDAFFAAVEQRDHPEFRGKPVIVGADPKGGKGRGIVATCSYEARKFGVHSAQPISEAWRLCPQGIYVGPGMAKYERASERVMAILLEFTDLVEQVSIDEAFLDVGGSRRLFGTGREIARLIKERICHDQHLTASVGVASSKFVAKVASDLEKPDGLVVVEPGQEREFLEPLAIGRLWGVGKKTEALLLKIGFSKIGQLARADRAQLVGKLGSVGAHLWELANGIDDRPVSPEEGYKSIGHETTFEHDLKDEKVLHDTLLELTEKLTQRLRAHHAHGRTITVKYREADFTTYTRRRSLKSAADTTEELFPVAWRLLKGLLRKGKLVRLIGVYASNLAFTETGGQLQLFDAGPKKDRRLAEALDSITRRFGDSAITRATLVPPQKKP
jgi:nucleotidyltransferase/DNA polymerase involved in DNA repair